MPLFGKLSKRWSTSSNEKSSLSGASESSKKSKKKNSKSKGSVSSARQPQPLKPSLKKPQNDGVPTSSLSFSPSSEASAQFIQKSAETPKKVVSFDERLNVRTKMAANHRHSARCWFEMEDIMVFQESAGVHAQRIAKSQAKSETEYRDVICRVYKACQQTAEDEQLREQLKGRRVGETKTQDDINTNPAEQEDDNVAVHISPQERKQFCKIVVSSSQVRFGLERMAVEYLELDYIKRRCDVIRALQRHYRKQSKQLEPQQQQQQQKQKLDASSSREDELIRQIVEPMSQTSRLFAREMGKAAETAAAAEQQPAEKNTNNGSKA